MVAMVMSGLALMLAVFAVVCATYVSIELRLGLGAIVAAMRRAQGLPPLRPGENPLDAIARKSDRT
ncbi:MAG: hypothetical protein Q8S73_26635 [Deltaproteobacteria bacterium]|nr:hypothetical protein [Deltaproteobacteria bacterium]